MDCAVKSLEKTSDIERKVTINKLHNMQWLKNTSHSANPEKIKAVVYKQEQDENKKIEDKTRLVRNLALTGTVKIHLNDKHSSTNNTSKTYLCNDNVPVKDEKVWNKNINTTNLFLNANKLADQKNEEDMLSIVESIITAKLEANFYKNKRHEDQSSPSENKAEDIIQDTVSTSPDLQKTDEGTEEMKLIKDSDSNNNDSKSTTSCMSKVNDKQKSAWKITSAESNKASTETKDKDAHVKTNTVTKTGIAESNTNLTKGNEKSSSPTNDSKKIISNSSKLLSITDKNGKDYFSNKQSTARMAYTRKQEFVKQRSVSRSGIEKEIKSAIAKPNLAKINVETIDTMCQNKNSSKDKALQQQTTPKQFTLKSKGQESPKTNASTLNSSDDKNKTEKAIHTPENVDSPLNESERKSEKIVNEKNAQSDQKSNRSVDLKKNTTFVSQYKNSMFSKATQNIPRIGQAATYGRNPSYAYNNPKFDRNRNVERRVTKKEHTPVNTKSIAKSNTETEELHTGNLENSTKEKKEIIQPTSIKSTCEVDTLVFNDKKDIIPAQMDTDLIQSKENTNSNIEESTSEQHRVETNIPKIDIDQQHEETNNEEMASFKPPLPSNLLSDKYATNSPINVIPQYSLKLEDMQLANDASQLESSQSTWNQSDNAAQKDTIMSLQQSIQNIYFNTQQTFTQAGEPTRQISPWEPNNNKCYDQHFSISDTMRLSQIPNTFNAPPYECSTSISNDNSVTATPMLESTSNRENSNVFYRYGPNVQQRSIMPSDFPGHSVAPCQTNQARWSSSVQDSFHVDHPYVASQPTMMHVYNPAVFNPDDFNNTHTMDVSHPVIYAPSPYMQPWNSQLQYPMPVLYNSPCTNYTTFPHDHQPNHFSSSVHNQQHKHNLYEQMNNYVRDTNTCTVQARNTADNVSVKSNYYKKYHDNCRAIYDSPQYVPPVSYLRSQQYMNFVPATNVNQYKAPYCPPNQKYRQNLASYMKNPKSQVQDFVCDDGSENAPPIISPTEFVTNNINPLNKTDQFATRVFRKPNSGYRPPPSYPRYNGGFRRNTTSQDFPREYTYPVSIGRGTYKTKKL